MVGFVARMTAPRCDTKLGVVAALSAFVAITFGQGIAGYLLFQQEYATYAEEAYEARVDVAQEAVTAAKGAETALSKAILSYADWKFMHEPLDFSDLLEETLSEDPSESAGELSWFIEEESEVTPEHIKEFKSTIVPELQSFLNGDPTKEDYTQSLEDQYRSEEASGLILLVSLVAANLHLFNIIFLGLGVSSAYKIAALEESSE